MLTGLVSIKIVAALIGPTGIALLGQLNNFTQILLSVSNGGVILGVTKYLSETRDSRRKYLYYLGTAFWITLVLSLVSGLVLVLFSGYFSRIILNAPEYNYVFIIFGVTIILYAFNALLVAAMNGFKEYGKYIKVNILSSLVGLIFAVTLCYYYGLKGALISAVTFQSVVFFLTIIIVAHSKWFEWQIFTRLFSVKILKQLSHFSLMALVSAIFVPVSQIMVRNLISKNLSVNEAGIWEAMNRISSMYLFVIITSLSVYYLPRLSELKETNLIKKEVFSVYKLVIPFMVLSGLVIYFLRDFIIQVLFTSEFNNMRDLFSFQLSSDIIKMASWILGYILIARAMTREYIIMEILHCTLFVLFSWLFIPYFGAKGAIFGYLASQIFYFFTIAFILRNIFFSTKTNFKK